MWTRELARPQRTFCLRRSRSHSRRRRRRPSLGTRRRTTRQTPPRRRSWPLHQWPSETFTTSPQLELPFEIAVRWQLARSHPTGGAPLPAAPLSAVYPNHRRCVAFCGHPQRRRIGKTRIRRNSTTPRDDRSPLDCSGDSASVLEVLRDVPRIAEARAARRLQQPLVVPIYPNGDGATREHAGPPLVGLFFAAHRAATARKLGVPRIPALAPPPSYRL